LAGSRTHGLRLWSAGEWSRRGFNLAATSALGLVTVAPTSAAPELTLCPSANASMTSGPSFHQCSS